MIWAVLLGWAVLIGSILAYYVRTALRVNSEAANDLCEGVRGLICGYLGMWYIALTLQEPDFCDGTGWEEAGAIISIISMILTALFAIGFFVYTLCWAL